MNNSFQEFWHYHSEIRPERKPQGPLEKATPLALEALAGEQFEISLDTQRLRPNHLVTLLTEVTGWTREIFGVYWYGAWRFKLPKHLFPRGSQFRFKLDGEVLQNGTLHFQRPDDVRLQEADVVFPEIPPRFIHGLENLRVCEDQQQQNVMPVVAQEATDWDVIVIGSGMGGGTLADALTDHSQKKPRVLVLEAGSLEYDTHIDNKPLAAYGRSINGHEVRNYEREGNSDFGMFPQMNFGGRSLFWSGLIPRMQEWELANWPAAVADYLRHGGYTAAEQLMRKHVTGGAYQENLIQKLSTEFPMFDVVDTPRSLHQPEFRAGGVVDSFLFRSTGTFSSAELLLDSLRSPADPGNGRLFVQCNHLVTKLVVKDRKVTEVHCQDLVGNRERVFTAKYVVLAAGSLESARLAMESKLEPANLIGKGLTDHPSYYAPNDGNFRLKATSPFAGDGRHAKIFFYPKQQWEGHWFNVEIVINGEYWNSRHGDDDVQSAIHRPGRPSTVNFKFIFGSPLQEGNYVQLGGPDGKLRLHVPSNPSGFDARPAVRKLLERLMVFLQVEPVDLDTPANIHFGNGGTVNHAGGTLRMGRQGQNRVVDENLKFVEYENLYACDPSVYPYIPAANPSLTLAALAMRLGDHLITRL